MGCNMSRIFRREGQVEKKEVEKNLPEPPPPAPLDPRLPVTARQKFSIVKSWKGIGRAMEPTGVHMFLRLFEEHAELLSLFDKFQELKTRDQQAESLELAEHATVVMNSIDQSIKAMDNADFFFDLLHQIGASHRKIPGFRKEYFWRIENPFLDAVKMTLDERYTENIEKVYKITAKLIIETVIDGYEKAEESEVNDNIPKPQQMPGELSTNSISIAVSPQSDNKSVNDTILNIKSTANATYVALSEANETLETKDGKSGNTTVSDKTNKALS